MAWRSPARTIATSWRWARSATGFVPLLVASSITDTSSLRHRAQHGVDVRRCPVEAHQVAQVCADRPGVGELPVQHPADPHGPVRALLEQDVLGVEVTMHQDGSQRLAEHVVRVPAQRDQLELRVPRRLPLRDLEGGPDEPAGPRLDGPGQPRHDLTERGTRGGQSLLVQPGQQQVAPLPRQVLGQEQARRAARRVPLPDLDDARDGRAPLQRSGGQGQHGRLPRRTVTVLGLVDPHHRALATGLGEEGASRPPTGQRPHVREPGGRVGILGVRHGADPPTAGRCPRSVLPWPVPLPRSRSTPHCFPGDSRWPPPRRPSISAPWSPPTARSVARVGTPTWCCASSASAGTPSSWSTC